jgi:hypothetical protein
MENNTSADALFLIIADHSAVKRLRQSAPLTSTA